MFLFLTPYLRRDRQPSDTVLIMLPPLTFRPVFKSMLWGGRRLPELVGQPAPHPDPIGEAWVLSDVDGSVSVVADGPHTGRSLRELAAEHPRALFGDRPPADGRFPLLLKFIDARQELSVQVHPCDEKAKWLAGPDKRGKTEAWVVLDRHPTTSRIYAGFREGIAAGDFRQAVDSGTAADCLHAFVPEPGDCVFLPAGTVHAIGADLLIFEVQQTSDITYRLHDWGRVDAKTGQPRDLHIDHGLLCSDFAAGPRHPVRPASSARQELVGCEYFSLSRLTSNQPMIVGAAGKCRAVVCIDGGGELVWADGVVSLSVGTVVLLPASVGEARFEPRGTATLLECGF